MSMSPTEAEWIYTTVLRPKEVPPARVCPCLTTSSSCRSGRHGDCGHDSWTRYPQPSPECYLVRWGTWPVRDGTRRFAPRLPLWLADRTCRLRCNCDCHTSPAAPDEVPEGDQLALFTT